jgi:membrane protein implicated in regulation of membrane protease activity
MSSISIPTPDNVPSGALALAGIFFIIAIGLIISIGLLAFSWTFLWFVAIAGGLMAIWFGFVIYSVWYRRYSNENSDDDSDEDSDDSDE